MQIYEGWIRRKANAAGEALVLGCTPELRHVLACCGFRTSLMDLSQRMYDATSSMLSLHRTERFLKSDWRSDTSAEPHHFDLILGDHVLNVIAQHDWHTLLGNVRNWLAPGGLFVTRVIVAPEVPTPLAEVLRRNDAEGYGDVADLIWDICLAAAYDRQSKSIRYRELMDTCRHLHEDNVLSDEVFRETRTYDPGMVLSVTDEPDLISLLGDHFDVISREHGTEYEFCRQMPVYALTAHNRGPGR